MLFVFLGLIITANFFWNIHFNANFGVISPGKVYKSGVISPDKISGYVNKYKIKTIVDLRNGDLNDPLNPGTNQELYAEKKAVEAIEGVNYVHIPSGQVPTNEQVLKFLSTLKGDDVFPVLIHCHHGTGRAMMYSSIYRIEHENMSPDEARLLTRNIVWGSSFDHGTEKGEFLKKYQKIND